jgi:hypothetical protein
VGGALITLLLLLVTAVCITVKNKKSMKEKIKKYYPFWLGIVALISINGITVFREAPSIGMFIMYIIGYFKLTNFNE